jgi:hypothetical protein
LKCVHNNIRSIDVVPDINGKGNIRPKTAPIRIKIGGVARKKSKRRT